MGGPSEYGGRGKPDWFGDNDDHRIANAADKREAQADSEDKPPLVGIIANYPFWLCNALGLGLRSQKLSRQEGPMLGRHHSKLRKLGVRCITASVISSLAFTAAVLTDLHRALSPVPVMSWAFLHCSGILAITLYGIAVRWGSSPQTQQISGGLMILALAVPLQSLAYRSWNFDGAQAYMSGLLVGVVLTLHSWSIAETNRFIRGDRPQESGEE